MTNKKDKDAPKLIVPPLVPLYNPRASDCNETYTARGRRWSTNDLIKAAEGLEPFLVPLASIDTSHQNFEVNCLDDFIYNVHRVNESSLEYPIIFDVYGVICNGYHRVVKAIIEGRRDILAVRLEVMPNSELLPIED
jgi:hypothetical protein